MIKFMLASREPEGGSAYGFNYEWRYIHVALMLTTPTVMKHFDRYAQHIRPDGVTDEMFVYGRHEMDWYNMSDHWVDSMEGLQDIFQNEDYPRRMTRHSFGDKNFVLELTDEGTVHFDQPTPFTGRGGVKLINFLRRGADTSQDDFITAWNGRSAAAIVDLAKSGGHIKRYVQNNQLPLDASLFKGSLFELGGVHTFAGIEEFWFESLDDLRAFAQDPAVLEVLDDRADTVDKDGSFSMVMVERVVWDYTEGSTTKRPAIENPDSVEAQILRQELAYERNGGWTSVLPPSDKPY